MSAYDDIWAAMNSLHPPAGRKRFVLVGGSAKQSIVAAMQTKNAPEWALRHIQGAEVRETEEFWGWAIRDAEPDPNRCGAVLWYNPDGTPVEAANVG